MKDLCCVKETCGRRVRVSYCLWCCQVLNVLLLNVSVVRRTSHGSSLLTAEWLFVRVGTISSEEFWRNCQVNTLHGSDTVVFFLNQLIVFACREYLLALQVTLSVYNCWPHLSRCFGSPRSQSSLLDSQGDWCKQETTVGVQCEMKICSFPKNIKKWFCLLDPI